MNKKKIRFGFVLLALLIFCFDTSLPAKKSKINFFLNLSTGNFTAFTYGAGADIKIYKIFSIKPSIDFTSIGGRILYLDALLKIRSSKRIKPFFSIGVLDYYFKGNNRHDNDAIKSITFGFGFDFYSKKGKYNTSLGLKIARTDETSFPIVYLNLIFVSLWKTKRLWKRMDEGKNDFFIDKFILFDGLPVYFFYLHVIYFFQPPSHEGTKKYKGGLF